MAQSADSFVTMVTGAMAFMLLLAAIIAFPISVGLIWLYRRAVLKSMKRRTSPPVNDPPAPFVRANAPAPEITVFDDSSSIPIGDDAANVYKQMQLSKWTAAAIYALAGMCFAFPMTVISLVSGKSEILPFRTLVFFLVYAFPVVLTINIVAPVSRRAKFVIAAIYFSLYAFVSAASVVIFPEVKLIDPVVLWIVTNLPGMLLLPAVLTRKIRAVGPLVLIFLFLAIVGSQLVISVAASDDTLLHFIMDFGENFGLGAYGVFFGLIFLGFIALVPVGWLFLRLIGWRYEKKKINDQSITLDAIWLLFGVVESLLMVFNGLGWVVSGFLAFLIYKIVVRIGFALFKLSAGSTADAKKLLVLRVFALGKRSEQLFGALEMHWRYAGSVQLIAGPDLATSTLEPHEFLAFVSGKLGRRFIDGAQTLDRRFSEMDVLPDRDGRFRVNDFFCHDDTWKMVLSRLVHETDAVIMDLRGFSGQNAGCLFEINELVNTVPVGRIVFIIDEKTDGQFLLQSFRNSWEQMGSTSPNALSGPARLSFFRFKNSGGAEFRQLLRTLCVAAQKT